MVLIVCGRGRVLAHPPPMGTGLWWLPAAGAAAGSSPAERLVVRTPRGFLFESPSTKEMLFVCNELIGIQDMEEASFATPDGTVLFVTTFAHGLVRGTADGCTWSPVTSVMTTPAFDVTVGSSGTGGTVYVVGGTPNQGDHFWAGQDAGTTWSPLANAAYPYTRVRAAASNPARIYLTGIATDATATLLHRLGVSNDGGHSVVDQLISLGQNDLQARVLDVDPMHPDHLYVYVESNSADIPEHILMSQDAGQSFTTGPAMHQIQGFAQSDDGMRVWVGGQEGLYRSTDGGNTFAPVPGNVVTQVSSLAFNRGQLYAGAVLNNQLVVAVSQDDGDTFAKVFSFDQVKNTLDCPGAAPGTGPQDVCAASWSHWLSELGTFNPSPIGGTTDAGAGGDAAAMGGGGTGGVAPVRAASAGCTVAAGHDRRGERPLGWMMVVLAVASASRRARRHTGRIGVETIADSDGRRGGRDAEPATLSLRELVTLRLDALTGATGFSRARRAEIRQTIDQLFATWGDELVGTRPAAPSAIADDYTPVALSLTLAGGVPEVGVLFEAQTRDGSVQARWDAGREVNRRMTQRFGASFERFAAIEDLFSPSASTAPFAMWHSIQFHPDRPPDLKVHLNPQARGRQDATTLVRTALRRLGCGRSAEAIARCPRAGDELTLFSLDVGQARQLRVEVHKVHPEATRAELERELSAVRDDALADLGEAFRLVMGGAGPFRRLPIGCSLTLAGADERPSSGAVHFPVRDYCASDRVVYERILRCLDGADREHYARAVSAFATRSLDSGVGMHAQVSLASHRGARRLTIGLALQAYQVPPPSPGAARSGCGRRMDATRLPRVPSLDGGLLSDARSCADVADDMGGLVSRVPSAVLRPRSRDDVIEMIRFCRDEGISAVARGQGTTLFGQCLTDGGIALDMSGLSSIKAVTNDRVVVDAGATWKDVLEATTAVGLAPPVLTQLQGTSVGGALSVGGIGPASYRRGAQVDHVCELEVVTGEGRLVVCSASQHRELFEAVLAGLGQCAVIVRASLRLTRAAPRVHHHVLAYHRRDAFLRALHRVAASRAHDGVSGTVQGGANGPWYRLETFDLAAAGTDGSAGWLTEPDVAADAAETREEGFLDFCLSADRRIAGLAAAGEWEGRSRPWLSVFLPGRSVDAYLDALLRDRDLAGDPDVHLFPVLRRHLGRPLLRVPEDELIFLVEVRACSVHEGSDAAHRAKVLDRNRRLYEQALALGGTYHVVSALALSRGDWIRHLGPAYAPLAEQKRLHDPDHVLGASVAMF